MGNVNKFVVGLFAVGALMAAAGALLIFMYWPDPVPQPPGEVMDDPTAPEALSPDPAAEPQATPAETIRVMDGFEVELVYSVPREDQGSWVALTVDPQGRIICSDQSGLLYRVTPPSISESAELKVEPIEVWVKDEAGQPQGRPIGHAQGLEHAFGALYVTVNAHRRTEGAGIGNGVYRLRDTNGDDHYDHAEKLLFLDGFGEHGPHYVRLGPGGESLYLVGGNATELPDYDKSRAPEIWDEDLLLPRMWDPRGGENELFAPAGWVVRFDPDGENVELMSMGYRNAYDVAFNRAGDKFLYDSDTEGDIGLAWYRPIRVNHGVSGAELGWRFGSGKWPPYYPDSLPAFLELGEGSPTGVTFGYEAAFPLKYQEALFLSDWSFGELHVAHLDFDGATYAGEVELFLAGTPLPITGIRVNPRDGALYFVTGGRGAQSGLYRVAYVGDEPAAPVDADAAASVDLPALHELRRELEAFHGHQNNDAVDLAWRYLAHEDRFIRYAARVAIEHQPVEQWADRAIDETDAQALIEAMIALARHGGDDWRPDIIEALNGVDYDGLTREQRLAWLRAYQLAFIRMGAPSGELRDQAIGKLDPLYPAGTEHENRELSKLAVYLEIPETVTRTVDLMETAETSESQIYYAYVLRNAEFGWDDDLRERYFAWFHTIADVRGGKSFDGYIENLHAEAVDMLDDDERELLVELLEFDRTAIPEREPRQFYRNWTTEEMVEAVGDREDLAGRSYERGREMFAAAQCFDCHRIGGEGGTSGPHLDRAGQQFSIYDLALKMVDPNQNVSNQYAATTFVLEDGTEVTGRISDMQGDTLILFTDPRAPSDYTEIDVNDVVERREAEHSLMPPGLAMTLNEEELRDLFAYLLAGGDPEHEHFEQPDDVAQ